MAVITETFYINNREFTRTYSDANRYVVRDGIEYSEACDPSEFGRTYTEGNIIPSEDSESIDQNIADKAEAYDILTGVSE